MPKSRFIILAALGFIALIAILIYSCILPGRLVCGTNPNRKITLTFWGIEPSSAMYGAFQSLGKNFGITYREFDPERYEETLINALAAGTGPDVFEIHARWLPKHSDKLLPAGSEQISIPAFESLYPTVAKQDFAPNNLIYALPLYLDTLALFYNRDIFDSDNVAEPPANWGEFQNLMSRLRRLDAQGRMVRAAAAIGSTSGSVVHASDLLSLLMLQSGAEMVSRDFSRASFASVQGANALIFYTGFANPAQSNFAWSDALGNSFDAFAAGKTAMVFGYAADLARVKEKNPSLPVGVTSMPQPVSAELEVNYADYWGVAVSKQTRDPAGAWDFARALAADRTHAGTLAAELKRLPAIRSLLQQKQNDPQLGTFAKAALSARSWPEIDKVEIDKIFDAMIDDVLRGRATAQNAISKAQTAVTTLMEKRNRQF